MEDYFGESANEFDETIIKLEPIEESENHRNGLCDSLNSEEGKKVDLLKHVFCKLISDSPNNWNVDKYWQQMTILTRGNAVLGRVFLRE